MVSTKLPKITIPKLNLPFLRPQRLAVGLDIGSHSIKMCQLAEAAGGYQLLALGNALLPLGAVEDGILQDAAAVGQVISSLVKNLAIAGNKVAISISGYSVIVKKINLAVMPEKDLETHIHSEAEQYIPFDIDDVYLDFQDLKTNATGEERTDIMLVAAKRDVVDSYLEMTRSAGLKTVVVDVDAFALENAFEANMDLKENIALIDIGASKININVIARGTSILTRDVVLGSRQLTEEIQQRLGVSYEEAESLKIGAAPPGDNQEVISEIFASACGQWVAEIKRAIDFYYANNPDEILGKLFLSGGGAKVKGLAEYLGAETGITVEIFNPFHQVSASPATIDPGYLDHIGPEMAIAAGLATRPVPF